MLDREVCIVALALQTVFEKSSAVAAVITQTYESEINIFFIGVGWVHLHSISHICK